MTFRVGEGGVEAGVLKEELSNPSMEVGVGLPIVRSIESGMQVSQQTLARGGHMRRSHGKSIWSIKKKDSTETPQDTSQGNLKIGRELGVPAQEGRDPTGGTRVMIGREVEEIITRKVEETTARKVGETTTKEAEENTAMGRVGETTALRGKVEETTARGIDKMEAEAGVGETTHLRRARGTLVRIGEGVTRGPLVMEGP